MHPQPTIPVHFAALFLVLSAAQSALADHTTIQPLWAVNSVTSLDGEINLGGSAVVGTVFWGFFTFDTDSPDISMLGRYEQRRGLFLANMSNHKLTLSSTTNVIDAPIVDPLDIADRYVVCCGGDCVFTNGDQIFGPPDVTDRYVACSGGGRAFMNGDQTFVGDPWRRYSRDPQFIDNVETWERDPQFIDNAATWVRMLNDVFETPMFGDFTKTRAGVRTRPMKSQPHQRSRMPRRTALQWGVFLGVAMPVVIIALLILIGRHTQQSNIVLEILVGGSLILALGMAILWLV